MVIRALRWANALLLACFSFLALFPFLNAVAESFSGSAAIVAGRVFLWPVEPNVDAYRKLIADGQLFTAMKNTVVITVVGTLLQVAATTLSAYALSKKRLRGRRLFLPLILFTMLFGGGLIPMFLLLKNLHLLNTYWAIWLTGLVSAYNLFVMKSFFEGLPAELEESAKIDGAGDLAVFARIALPLSKAIIAAISLFCAVSLWNVYQQAVYYLNSSALMPLMVRLYQMIQFSSDAMLNNAEATLVQPEALKAAAIVVSVLPILLVYPFLQKYFVKGVLLGSVKG